jgi:hypothetical protein
MRQLGPLQPLAALAVALALVGCGAHHQQVPLRVAPPQVAQAGMPQAAVLFGADGRTLASYNTGLQIGNFVWFYKDTWRKRGSTRWLDRAVALANTGYRSFGALAYPIPPGNSAGFGAIYLRQLQSLVPLRPAVGSIYRAQRAAYLSYVRSHPARGGSAHRWPNGLWADKQQRYAYLWPMAAVTAAAESRGDCRAPNALRFYWTGSAWRSALTNRIKPTGDVYTDDNVWAALDELACPTRQHIAYAQRDFALLRSGWERFYGGVRWVFSRWNHDIATVSTAGAEQVALMLYARTRRPMYLSFAYWAQGWIDRHVKAPSGLLYDHLTPCGKRLCWSVPAPTNSHPVGGFSDPLLYQAAEAA